MSSIKEVEVSPVKTRSQWKAFFDFRREIYRQDPAAVMPLRWMEKLQLDPEKHPFYLHAEREAFICLRKGRVVGRIVAFEDRLHNEYHNERIGFFGFFECIDDVVVSRSLLGAASKWLKDRGLNCCRGPVNPSMKGEFGVLVEGHDIPPYVMMGHTPKYYERLMKESGFEVAKRFFAFRFNWDKDYEKVGEQWAKIDRAVERIRKRFPKLEYRAVDRQNYEQTLRDINAFGNVVRRHNYGFVPLTNEELNFMIAQLRRVIRFDMIHAAYWEDELVGFIVNVPDINWALRKTRGSWDWLRTIQLGYWMNKTPRTRVIAIGVHEEYRKKGIGIVLINLLKELKEEYNEWEFSWVVEDNLKSIGAIAATMPLTRHKTYHLYERTL